MKYLYKYPQLAYPYDNLVKTNAQLGFHALEYELIHTGVFEGDRYFDVFVEYAKASPDDLLVEITVHNRGPEPASLYLLPTVWFRNTWSWGGDVPRPTMSQMPDAQPCTVAIAHPELCERFLYCDGGPDLLFTENETNTERIFGSPNASPYVKDAVNNYLVHGASAAVSPAHTGTKAAAHYALTVDAQSSRTVRLRLSDLAPKSFGARAPFGAGFDATMTERRRDADQFYASVIPASLTEDEARVMRQALAGMLWSKQFYLYDVDRWLEERGSDPFKRGQLRAPRNDHWHHMYNADIISMPDKWEYPWYAAWDLAFHVLALTLVDEDFGKEQLDLMLQARYLHPNGQLPAYEWNFGDVNPPVHAWSTIFTYRLDKLRKGCGDTEWLEKSFHKLLMNFTWWVNRRTGAATISSRAGSSGWTTSASSIGARRCRPAGIWSKPTAPPGWRSSPRTCSRSPPSCRSSARPTSTCVRSSWSTSSGSPRRWCMPATMSACGTRRTGSSTTCSGCPTGAPSASRSDQWSACCRCAPSRCSKGTISGANRR
jgi:hypothetical protein